MRPTLGNGVPTVEQVTHICGIRNRVLRNLEITECYARLSRAMRSRTADLANWCTFAAWASRQAGSTIRGEDFLAALRRHLGRKGRLLAPFQSIGRVLLRKGMFEPDTRLGRAVAAVHTPFDAFERASEAVSEGNLKVFTEIGLEFARYLHTVPPAASGDSVECSSFLAGFRPGDPPDGQDLLKEAFTHYQQQTAEADAGARAALMLLANLKIGLHEQTRLQPQIAAAVDAPAVTAADLGRRALHALVPGSRRWPALAHGPAVLVAGILAQGVRRAGVRLTRQIVTESMMVLSLPGTVLFLGRDLDAPVPPVLGAAYPELDAFVGAYDACPPGGTACGATDWCDLSQRMHFIVHLFRAYLAADRLFDPPFTDAQVAAFQAGRIPEGAL